MGDEYYQPTTVEEDQQKRGGGGKSRSAKIQRLRPYKAGDILANHLQILLYQPCNFNMFRGVVAPEVKTFWMAFPSHYIGKSSDGASVVCKKRTNDYYAKNYGAPLVYAPAVCPMCGKVGVFLHCVDCGAPLGARVRDDICPSCDEADRHWGRWQAEWDAQLAARGLATGKEGQKKVKNGNQSLYKELTAPGTQIQHLQQVASGWTAKDRFLYVVLDNDKALHKRDLLDGESETLTMTLLFAGRSIQEALTQKRSNGKKFYDPSLGMEIVVTRDTRNGMERTTYTLDDAAGPPLSPEWLAYLTNYKAMPDPSTEVEVLSYEDHVNKAGLTLTREEVVPAVAGAQQSFGLPPTVPPVATASAVPASVPPVAPVGLGRPPAVSAPTPFSPPAAPPVTASSMPPAPTPFAPPTAPSVAPMSGPPPFGAAPPGVPPVPPVGAAPPSAPPGAPPVAPLPAPHDSGRRQTW